MNRQQVSPPLAACAIAAGLSGLLLAVIQLTSGPFEGHYVRTVEYFNDFALIGLLGFAAGGEIAVRRTQGGSPWAIRTAIVGQCLLVFGISVGIALAEDPDWFFVIGAPGQLLWLTGTVGLGVQIWKARVFPRWTAVGVALTVPFGIIGAEFGLTAVVGATWLFLGLRMLESSRGAGRMETEPSASQAS